jgi:hypothetical protein
MDHGLWSDDVGSTEEALPIPGRARAPLGLGASSGAVEGDSEKRTTARWQTSTSSHASTDLYVYIDTDVKRGWIVVVVVVVVVISRYGRCCWLVVGGTRL